MIVVSQTTTLSVLGAGMALRGPDGSMMTATDGLYEERNSVFLTFGAGLACTVGSVLICVWLILHWEAALCCMILVLFTCRTIWLNYQRVQRRFAFDESETVDFRDIMEGPANIQTVYKYNNKKSQSSNIHQNQNINGYNDRRRHHHDKNNSTQISLSSTEIGHGGADERDSDDWSGDWAQSQQRLIRHNNDVKKRRETSSHPAIQTI